MGFIPLYYVNKFEKEDKILSQPFEQWPKIELGEDV